MNDKTELKPCPNPWCYSHAPCEEDATHCLPIVDRASPNTPLRVYCQSCPIVGPSAGSTEAAIEAWNTRPTSNHENLVEQLRNKAQELLDHRHATAGWLMQEAADAIEALGGKK